MRKLRLGAFIVVVVMIFSLCAGLNAEEEIFYEVSLEEEEAVSVEPAAEAAAEEVVVTEEVEERYPFCDYYAPEPYGSCCVSTMEWYDRCMSVGGDPFICFSNAVAIYNYCTNLNEVEGYCIDM